MLVIGITNKKDLVRVIVQEPLIDPDPSLNGISTLSDVTALYFGVGLSNGVPMLSKGLPIDVLSMILCAEQLNVPKHILIADTHAITNGFDFHSVDMLAAQYQEILQSAIENMGLALWYVVRASEFDHVPNYRKILTTVEAPHDYIKRELTDMRWFNSEHNVNLKIGWTLNGTKNSDEIAFDQEFQRQFNDPMGFVYVTSGRTFDPKRLRSAPYFCINPQERILLQADENVAEKIASAQQQFGQQATRPYLNYLNHIVRLYDRTVQQTERGPTSERLQQVIERCTQ